MMGGIGSMMGGFGMAGIWVPLLLATVLLVLLVWTTSGEFRREERPAVVVSATFEDVLRGRLERGEVSAHEFEHALRQLRDS